MGSFMPGDAWFAKEKANAGILRCAQDDGNKNR